MYLGMPDTKAAVAFLKQEYGPHYGHNQTYQDGGSGFVHYSPKGMEFQHFSPGGSFRLTWNRIAARLKELVSGQDYFTPEEKERWDAIVREFQQRGEPVPPPVPCMPYPPPYHTGQLTQDTPPFHRQYLPEILRYEGRAASWAALSKFFMDHPEENTRVGYLHLLFGEDPHQLTALDGTGIGFQGFPDHLRVWEGSALTLAAEARLTWPEVCLLVEQEIAQEQAPPETAAEMPPQEAVPETPEPSPPPRAISQAGIDAAIQAWNGSIESKHAVVRYMREHGREKGTAAWLRQEYGDDLPAFPVTVDGAAADVPWPRVQRRIARLIREDRFYTQAEQDNFDNIDPIAIREELARRGIVNGQVVDPEKLDSDPFIRQVMADVERIARAEEPEDMEASAPAPTVREIYEQYLPVVREKVLADKAYQNACRNSDRENAMLEGAEAVKRAVSTIEDTAFLRLYYDLAGFHNDIHRAVLEDTYTALAAPAEQEAREAEEPKFTTETVAAYPAEENHLPYDVVFQTIRTSEPEPPAPSHNPEPEPPQPEAGNFRITDLHLGEGGPKEKFRRNVEAIRTLKQIEAEGRGAAAAEQEVLSRYVGWGGLPDAFDPEKENWAREYQELRGLLTDTEYAAARSSTLNAHYTSPTVINAIYEALGNLGFQTGNILEPACGVGNFFGLLPKAMAGSKLYGVELDSISGRIAALLYPDANILVRGFEQSHFPDSFFDAAIGNVPFGAYKVNDERYNKLGFHIHNYFFAKALDQVRLGGIVAFVTSRYTMDSKDEAVRRYLAQRAELLGAIRLPNNAFRANAGTDVVSDILFLQKRDHLIDLVPDWVHTQETPEGFSINRYFQEHPEMVLGQAASEHTQYGRQDYTVIPIPGADLAQ